MGLVKNITNLLTRRANYYTCATPRNHHSGIPETVRTFFCKSPHAHLCSIQHPHVQRHVHCSKATCVHSNKLKQYIHTRSVSNIAITKNRTSTNIRLNKVARPAVQSYSSSSLFVARDDTSTVELVHLDLDIETTFNNFEELQQNIENRRIQYINIVELKDMYMRLQELRRNEDVKLAEKRKNSNSVLALVKREEKGKIIKTEIKNIQRELWPLEEKVMLSMLKIPVNLHVDTPENDIVIKVFGGEIRYDAESKNHVEILQNNNSLRFSAVSPRSYYMQGDLALLELDALDRFINDLRNINFIQFSCPDIVKTIVVEGCGKDFHDPDEMFTVQSPQEDDTANSVDKLDTTYHLIGGGDYVGMLAYFTKMKIRHDSLPLRCFTMGRYYSPYNSPSTKSLLAVPQTNRVSLFGATTSACEAELLFAEFQDILYDLYEPFNFPTRIVRKSASKLRLSESACVQLQIWLPSELAYRTVAEVSLCNDFISRRLMIQTSKEDGSTGHLYTLHGYVLDTAKLLAVTSENTSNRHA